MKDMINCPNCGHHFHVEEALTGKIREHIKAEYEQKIVEQSKRFTAEKKKLDEERIKLQEQKESQDQLLKKELEKALNAEKDKIKKNTFSEFENQLKELQEENQRRRNENKSLKEKEFSFLKREAELKEKQEELQLNIERELLERQKEIEEKARKKEREEFELERIKLKKQLEDQTKLADEMKRKAEQGSMQMQGEVQELAIENLLKNIYPFDIIQEVKKGERGADVIQTVINSLQNQCGKIVYESKRTKNFNNEWIDKLKNDQIIAKADIAVLVTETMPKDMEKFGELDGVWVCGFHEVKSLSFVLREMLIKVHSVKKSEENKGDKMELLYKYLTGNEFVQNVKRIVENYETMQNQLTKEKNAMHRIWKEREKQITIVQENLAAIFGSIKGIAGNALDSADLLELPEK
jgi:hypothetical protein